MVDFFNSLVQYERARSTWIRIALVWSDQRRRVTRLGYLLNGLGSQFSYKSSPKHLGQLLGGCF